MIISTEIKLFFIFGIIAIIIMAAIIVFNNIKNKKTQEKEYINNLLEEPATIVAEYLKSYIKNKNINIPKFNNNGIKEIPGLRYKNVGCAIPLTENLVKLIQTISSVCNGGSPVSKIVTEKLKKIYPQIIRIELYTIKCFNELDEVALIYVEEAAIHKEEIIEQGLKDYYNNIKK